MEKIIIKNFGPIEDAEIEIRKVLVLIGEQASGKSTIAKLVFFFKTIGDEFYQNFKWGADQEVSTIENQLIDSLTGYFLRFFSTIASDRVEFTITMTYSTGLNIYIFRENADSKALSVEVSTEAFRDRIAEMIPLFGDVRSFYRQLANEIDQNTRDTIRETISEIRSDIRKKLIHLFGGSFDSRLFVPAARVESIDKSVGLMESWGEGPNASTLPYNYESSDELLLRIYKQVIAFEIRSLQRVKQMEFLPLHFAALHTGDPMFAEFLIRNRKILKGNLVADEYGLMIALEKNGKTVRMPDASSGQKSTSPIIIDIAYSLASQEKVFRVIEEPEAHLFPTAQKQLIELLVFLANAQPESQVIITTHSPYVLTSVNNMLMAYHAAASSPASEAEISALYPPKFRIAPDDLATYSLGNTAFEPEEGDEPEPFFVDILNRKTGMIAQNYLDTVSLWLGHEFHFLMGIYRKANPRRAAQ